MKKLIVGLVTVILLCGQTVYASELKPVSMYKTPMERQRYINQIGFRLLNANKIKLRMNFYYNTKSVVNAYSAHSGRTISLYEGIYRYFESEDEIAAVLGHEISHSIDSYDGILRGAFEFVPHIFLPRKYERRADKRSIDFMVKAGYNPVAMIVMMNKVFDQHRYEFLSSHPLSSRRMAFVYEYIYYKYPEFLKNNPYQDNIYYQNFLLTSQENRRKLQKKVESGSKKKVRYY